MKIVTIVLSIVAAGVFANANPTATTPATEAVHAESVANHAEADVKDAKVVAKAAKKDAKKHAKKAAKAQENNEESAH